MPGTVPLSLDPVALGLPRSPLEEHRDSWDTQRVITLSCFTQTKYIKVWSREVQALGRGTVGEIDNGAGFVRR